MTKKPERKGGKTGVEGRSKNSKGEGVGEGKFSGAVTRSTD